MRSNTKRGEAVDRFGLPTVKYIQLPMVHTKREPVSRSGTNRLLTNDAYERLLVDLTYPNNSKFDSYQYFVEKFCFFQEIHFPDLRSRQKLETNCAKWTKSKAAKWDWETNKSRLNLKLRYFKTDIFVLFRFCFGLARALLGSTWGSTSTRISTSDFLTRTFGRKAKSNPRISLTSRIVQDFDKTLGSLSSRVPAGNERRRVEYNGCDIASTIWRKIRKATKNKKWLLRRNRFCFKSAIFILGKH